MRVTILNGQRRYQVELTPGSTAEANSLETLLTFILNYGGYND